MNINNYYNYCRFRLRFEAAHMFFVWLLPSNSLTIIIYFIPSIYRKEST